MLKCYNRAGFLIPITARFSVLLSKLFVNRAWYVSLLLVVALYLMVFKPGR